MLRRAPELLNSHEEEFMYSLCRWYLGQEPGPLKHAGLREKTLFHYIRNNKCAGIFYKYLENNPGAFFKDREMSRDHYFGIFMNNEVYCGLASHLDRVCQDSGIPYACFKGISLIRSVYQELGVRPVSDIDLIVASRKDAVRLIQRLALAPPAAPGKRWDHVRDYGQADKITFSYFSEEYKTDAAIEIHFPVKDSPFLIPTFMEIHSERILNRPLSEPGLKIIDHTLHAFILIVHLIYQHFGSNLIWHLDVAKLIHDKKDDLDWNLIVRESIGLGCRAAFFHFLSSLQRRFGVMIPRAVLRDLKGPRLLNGGILREMVSPKNVIEDSLGGQDLCQNPTISLKRAKPILFYSLFYCLLYDLPQSWIRFIFGRKRHSQSMGELIIMTFARSTRSSQASSLKKALGAVFLALASLVSIPIHLFYNLKSSDSA